MQLNQKTAEILLSRNKTIAVAESCTGGLLSNALTDIPGASTFFWLGVIVYDNKAKAQILQIPLNLIKKHGAVSAEVAGLMAKNVRKLLKTDFGVGITGIAGPSGGTKNKPVGLVYIAIDAHNKNIAEEFHFKGSRTSIKSQAASAALKMLLCALS
jgi:nicotinamide-nucleotide amidase